jgi:catechol 2,3-dioxygenase-like lactoylglutathione lyase family enzyme
MTIEVRGLAPLLEVFDMPASIAFYRDVLGFSISGTDGRPVPHNDWVLLELNGVQLMLNTAYEEEHRPPAPDNARIAAHGDTCIYFGCPDVDGAWEHLKAKGIDLGEPKIAPYGMKQLYLRDPDGYGICFQWPAEKHDESGAGR